MYMYSISMKVNKYFFYSTLTPHIFKLKFLLFKIKLEKIKHINKSYEMPESHSAKPFIVKSVIKKN